VDIIYPRSIDERQKLMQEFSPDPNKWFASESYNKMVKDKTDNTNNRFGVGSEINRRLTGGPFPFWGCPPKDALTTLQPKRTRAHGPGDLPEFRHADLAAKGAASIWKLYYNGSVGGQALLGIPAVRRLKLAGDPPWAAVWTQIDKMVKDKADNTNNRFGAASEINRRLTGGPFPFWGCPPKDALTTLQPKRTRAHGPDDLPEFRHGEMLAKGCSPIWKLYYNGSVGGQALLGIPALRRLKQARGEAVKIWPFETGLKTLAPADLDGVEAVVCEVYPSLYKVQPAPGEVKDLAQVRATAEHFARLDEAGKLGVQFGPPKGTADEVVADAEREEGWVLGTAG